MTDIGKFLSDVEKIKKFARNSKSSYSYSSFSEDLRNLFIRSTTCPTDLPNSIFEYWENKYILSKEDEVSTETIQKLGAMLAFLDNNTEDEDLLSFEDWQELAQLVNYEAEDLPVDILQDLMMLLVNHGAY